MTEPIHFTTDALRELKRLQLLLKVPESFGLRIESRPGSGTRSYHLSFDEKKESDLVYTMNGLQLFIPKQQLMFLSGMQVDYIAEENGFLFLNPLDS